MPLWLLDSWKPILGAISFLLSYPVYRIARTLIRVSRNQYALEVCREDLRITKVHVVRLREHLEASGVESSTESEDHLTR